MTNSKVNKNGKRKGSAFERKISKMLSLWWSHGKDDSLFWRTQNSGGRFTTRIKLGESTSGNQDGDITSTTNDTLKFSNIFHIECKCYKDIKLWSLLNESNGFIKDWWTKAREISNQTEKIPWLIIKENNQPILLLTDEYMADKLIFYYNLLPKATFYVDNNVVTVYRFDHLLTLDVEVFKTLINDSCGFI